MMITCRTHLRSSHLSCGFLVVLLLLPSLSANGDEQSAARGYRLLTEKPYLPPDFDQETFDAVWEVWPEPLRSQAASASADERRQLAFERYGLTTRPGDASGVPLQYVVDADGNWTMNCFACHGGSVRSVVIPGAPNAFLALETLTDEIRQTKLRLGKSLSRMDLGSLVIPLGSTVGTTNAVVFGVGLMALRDAELNLLPQRLPSQFLHHDMDAPPWWHFSRKHQLYIDGFAPKSHRALMQFMLVPENGPQRFREWESDFRDIFAYLRSVQPPKYFGPIDEPLALAGQEIFRAHCGDCHGPYEEPKSYPEVRIEIGEIGTDPLRLAALTTENRQRYQASWFGRDAADRVVVSPTGYVAPPLDGIWASAPYFHNGSVPTLWHVLRPKQRPPLWRRRGVDYDSQRIGLSVEEFSDLPRDPLSEAERREFFDTRRSGKSASGHTYPEVLSENEKAAVLEYLKTL
jgi:hypothetical protein